MVDDLILECGLDPARVSFLLGPTHFYERICDIYRNATKRVVLACLYVGNEDLEEQLIRSILEAKNRNEDLVVDVLVDKSRTMRVGKLEDVYSSLSLFKPYLSQGDGVNVALFHNPLYGRLLSKIIKPPYCEAFGTMHMKVYIGDDECILTGANAGRDYFRDRYDRYMVVQDPLFCDLMHTFVKTFQTASFTLTDKLTAEWLSDLMNPISDNMLFRKQLYHRIHQMVSMCKDILKRRERDIGKSVPMKRCEQRQTSDSPSGVHGTATLKQCEGDDPFIISEEGGAVSDVSVEARVVQDLHSFQACRRDSKRSDDDDADDGSTVAIDDGSCREDYPFIILGESKDRWKKCDSGQTDVTVEAGGSNEYCFIKVCIQMPFSEPAFMQGENLLDEWIIQYVKKGYSIFIATAYLNFTDRFINLFKRIIEVGATVGKHNPLQVVTSSPYANSFYNGGYMKRHIALFYTSAAKWLLSAVKQEDGYPQDIYMEYNRPKHTFHAKGIWICKKRVPLEASHVSEEEFNAEMSLPCSMVIGSSNYGRRSCAKDLEVIFFVETNSQKLRSFMKQELYEMVKHSEYVSYETLRGRVGLLHRIIAALVNTFF